MPRRLPHSEPRRQRRAGIVQRPDHAWREGAGEKPAIPSCSVQWGSQGAVEAIGRAAGLSRDGARAAVRRLVERDLPVTSKGGSSHATIYVLSAEDLRS